MGKERIMLTREGRDKLCVELERLKGEKRREIAKALAEARSHGDLSENAEYDAAKEAQAHNEKKINELEDILMRARILDDTTVPKDKALLGCIVKVKDKRTGEEFEYILVSEEESDFEVNKISVSSPVGRALLGRKIGETVEIQVPAGLIEYEIVELRR
ncbi:MAG: transcription elongation factor GreA [Candidatus Omnitrophica bacterium]|nr:transcription elongation factor GreA [Candidatus Omnitrophota bacterium]